MRKLIFLLPVILLLFNQRDGQILLSNNKSLAYAKIDTITATQTTSGYFNKNSLTSWSTVRDATTSSAPSSAGAIIGVWKAAAGAWNNSIMILSFPIPNMASLTSAKIRLDGLAKRVTTDRDSVWTVVSAKAARSGGLTSADYINFAGHASSGAYTISKLIDDWNSSTYSTNWNEFTFNAGGLDTIETVNNDTLYVAFMHMKHVLDLAPADPESLRIDFSGWGATSPNIVLDYEPAVVATSEGRGLLGGDISEGRKW